MERITMSSLVMHGEGDRPVSRDLAHRSSDHVIASARADLKISAARGGGVEHVGADDARFGRDPIADPLAERLGGHTA